MKRFEGLRRKSARLSDGGWTIGYGHTRSAREGAEVGPDAAESLLIYDLRKVAEAVVAQVYTPLNQNQFDALCAFVFNIGIDNFQRSAVLKRLNEGHYLQAAAALELWRKAEFDGEGLVVDALVRRRAAEKALFLTPPDGFRPTPTPVLRVLFDPSVLETLEQRRAGLASPVVLSASLDGETATLERERPFLVLEPEDAPSSLHDYIEPSDDEAPSAALAAAANVRSKLERLFPDEAPPPPVDPRTDFDFPEPQAAPESAPEAEPETAFEPHPEPEPEPEVETDPPPPPTRTLFDPLAPRAEPEPAPVAEEDGSGFGRRTRPIRYNPYLSAPRSRRNHSPYGAPMLILALVGIAMFCGSIVAMLGGKATFAMLGIGLVGVICMAPAAIRFLLNRIEPEPGSGSPNS